MNKFKGNRRIWWIVASAVIIAGITAAMVVLPSVSAIPGSTGPDIRVPKMQNVPPSGASRMQLDYNEKR